ncbi:hypothetical protein Micbo1qcDRAFT_206271 [Microdochium bolleyi]|uniref:F-box domain-containing protein n=1 Tax=Microdochium bolleyi TaxID=196109 RepID=A0A136IWN9_9PEZI|nr:hypothetical protein Micbo1qcDRAFT_206271 [Microdochium bolleyi]
MAPQQHNKAPSRTAAASHDIFKSCCYRPSELQSSLIMSDSPGPQNDTAVTSLLTSPNSATSAGLGSFEVLPMALKLKILEMLNLISYLALRQASRAARKLATENHKYQALMQYARKPLQGMVRVNMGDKFSIGVLYQRLVTPTCSECCAAFGSCLFLPTSHRCCIRCLDTSAAFAAVNLHTIADAAQRAGFMSLDDAARFLATSPLAQAALRPMTRHPLNSTRTAGYTRTARPPGHPPLRAVSYWDLPARVRRSIDDDCGKLGLRRTAAVEFPWYDPATDQVDSGVSCAGCQGGGHRMYVRGGKGDVSTLRDEGS